MHLNRVSSLLNITPRAINNTIISRNYYKKPFSYDDFYRGKFDYHNRNEYPRSMSKIKEEELLDEVHSIKNNPIENPSPFHLVKRYKGSSNTIRGWHTWVTLRRLNLHSARSGDIAVVPNTPQYNAMIEKVKHLLIVKPLALPDGRIPTESDIGAIKVCAETGNVTIDERTRLLGKRQYEKPLLWRGKQLRHKLRRLVGIHHNHYLR